MLNAHTVTPADFTLNTEGETLTADQLGQCVAVHAHSLEAARDGCHVGTRQLEIAGVDIDAVIVGELFECQDHYCEVEEKMEYYTLQMFLVRPWNRAKKHDGIKCSDGFGISIQAHEDVYCTPRKDKAEAYTAVELGYPTFKGERFDPAVAIDDGFGLARTVKGTKIPDHVLDTLKMLRGFSYDYSRVYGFVPVELVNVIISRHGGSVSGSAPAGVYTHHAARNRAEERRLDASAAALGFDRMRELEIENDL